MSRVVDLTGQRFVRLVVIERTERPKSSKERSVFWLCECDCDHKRIVVDGHSLRQNRQKSCGCLQRENAKNNYIDLMGKKFGRLTVIEKIDKPRNSKTKNRGTYWLCNCSCDNKTIIVSGASLRSGNTQSCGCLQKESGFKEYQIATFNRLYKSYLIKAEQRNLVFEISKDYFYTMTKQNCFYCGKEPHQVIKSKSNNGDYIYNGIDRLYSDKGYTKGNCVPCCGQCNVAKMAIPHDEFLIWIDRVYKHLHRKECLYRVNENGTVNEFILQ